MKPERPKRITQAQAARLSREGHFLRRVSIALTLAGTCLVILHVSSVETRSWSAILSGAHFLVLPFFMAYLARKSAAKMFRLQAGMPVSELIALAGPPDRPKSHPGNVAPLPEDALEVRAHMLASGKLVGKRRLSKAEREELLYRNALPTVVMVVLFMANLLVILAIWIDPGVTPLLMLYFVIAFIPAMVLYGLLAPRVRRHFARSVRVVNRGGVWVELLGNTNQPWTIDGEPAEWRLK